MEKKELEGLRDRVPCGALLEQAGFAIDVKESTRRAVKYRRDAQIVIVIHEGRGWFDPLAAFEGLREGSLYLSTGGGWSPATDAALSKLAARPGVHLVAATDANGQGETFAGRLRDIADAAGCDWLRLMPPVEDWNDALRAREKEKKERKRERSGRGLPHARRPRQG